MKKIFLFLIACFSIVECVGHDIQSNENASLPAESLTKRLHGRKTTEYRFNGTDYNATVTYYDGLGRPEQRIAVGASPAGKDKVEFSVYDRMGRADSVTFLPYTITGTGGYRSNPHLEQRNFYKAYTNNAPDADYAYNLKEYDDSPLGVETGYSGPGIYHSAHSASGHPVKISYRLNYTPDKIKKYFVIHDDLKTDRYYPTRTLIVECRLEEIAPDKTRETRKYMNGRGQMVAMTELINATDPRTTYYVYDEFDNLRFIIPHIADAASETWESSEFMKYWIYYTYDEYGNKIIESNPGAEKIYHVYDNDHRVVLTQDGNHRLKKQWIHNQYDEFGRLVKTNLITCDTLVHKLRDLLIEKSGKDVDDAVNSVASTTKLLSQTEYGGYKLKSSIFLPIHRKENEGEVQKALERDASVSDAAGASLDIGNILFPNYFVIPSYLAFQAVDSVVMQTDFCTDNTGLKIYEKLAVLPEVERDSSAYVEKAYYYDKYGRVVQSVVRNHLGGITRISNKYDDAGNRLETIESRQPDQNAIADIKRIRYAYDKFGRLLSEQTTLNDSQASTVRYEYNELGLCAGTIYGDSLLHTTYAYDIAGRQILQDNEVFTMSLHYEDPQMAATEKNYSGLITECTWQHKGVDDESQTYAYTYLPRGQFAGVSQYSGTERVDKYIEKDLTYDLNDNILTLTRLSDGNVNTRDEYTIDGNQLSAVNNKAVSDLQQELTRRTYQYHNNGYLASMTIGTSSWKYQYNCLNLPMKIELMSGSAQSEKLILTHEYSYLSDGTKLCEIQKESNEGNIYLGSLTYRMVGGDLSLHSAQFTHGNIAKTSNGYAVNYYVRDYLGSIRVIVDENGNVTERNNYYPLGKKWSVDEFPQSENNYLFNGKELLASGMLDYHARMYDPNIGRWLAPDPAMQTLNPYIFCNNNPVAYVDSDGEFISFIFGFFRGLFTGKNPIKTGWNTQMNSLKIIRGLFRGNFRQIISRLTWESLQTFIGLFASIGTNWITDVDVDYAYGATVTRTNNWSNWGAFTLGSYIIGNSSIAADPANPLFQHEYGHYLQSRAWGPVYLFAGAIPSLASATWAHINSKYDHDLFMTEQDANVRALRFWEKKYPGFYTGGWNRYENPISDFNWSAPFDSPENQQALQDGIMFSFDFSVKRKEKRTTPDNTIIIAAPNY